MNKIALSVIASLAVAGGALAGQPMVSSGKETKTVIPPTPCFRDTELQLDVFGSYTGFTSNKLRDSQDGVGGGLGVSYYFTRHIGIGVDGHVFDAGVHGLWTFTGNILARFPIEAGGVCLAPYVLAGGGLTVNGSAEGVWNLGGGLEWRVVPEKLGIYAEGRYIWSDDKGDAAQARLGVRFVF